MYVLSLNICGVRDGVKQARPKAWAGWATAQGSKWARGIKFLSSVSI